MAVTPVISASTPNASSADVTVTLPAAPAADDVVFISINGIVNGSVDVPPAGWVNVLGEGVLLVPGDASICMAVLCHVVTEGEATAEVDTWTLTAFWSAARACEVQATVLRGVDLAAVVKVVGTVTNASNSTTHVLPAVDGASVPASGDFVLRAVMADDLSTYTTPAGHTLLATSNTIAGSWLGHRNALTTAETTVDATNIAATISGESAGFTLIVGAAAGGGPVTVTLGQAAETDTSNTIAAVKTPTVAAAAETDTAQAVAAAKTVPLSAAVEADTSQPVTVTKTLALGQAAEVDTARPLTFARSITLGQALEVDTAFPVTTSAAADVTLGLAAELDAVGAVAATKTVVLGLVVEFDQAMAMILPSLPGPYPIASIATALSAPAVAVTTTAPTIAVELVATSAVATLIPLESP